MGSKFTELIIDAADPDALARFWQQVLGWPRLRQEGDAVELGRDGDLGIAAEEWQRVLGQPFEDEAVLGLGSFDARD